MHSTTNQEIHVTPARHIKNPRIQPVQNGIVSHGQVLVTRVGLDITVNLTYDNWERAGHQLAGIADSSAWCLGDWLVYGKKHYADRYKIAIRAAGLDYQTLRNYAWVARRFDIGRRRDRLSFQHHAEVASLPVEDQEKWLDLATAATWSVKKLRTQLRGQRDGVQHERVATTSLLPRIEVANANLERWQAAAEKVGRDLGQWMVSALDHAATQTLDDTA
jgi:hypothetical protein